MRQDDSIVIKVERSNLRVMTDRRWFSIKDFLCRTFDEAVDEIRGNLSEVRAANKSGATVRGDWLRGGWGLIF